MERLYRNTFDDNALHEEETKEPFNFENAEFL